MRRTSVADHFKMPAHPRLEGWQWRADGSLDGFVFGKSGYKDGDSMTTSHVPESQRYAGIAHAAS